MSSRRINLKLKIKMKQNWKKKSFVSGLTLLLMVLFSSFTINDLHGQEQVSGTVTGAEGCRYQGAM